jgi:hypothetical protein
MPTPVITRIHLMLRSSLGTTYNNLYVHWQPHCPPHQTKTSGKPSNPACHHPNPLDAAVLTQHHTEHTVAVLAINALGPN